MGAVKWRWNIQQSAVAEKPLLIRVENIVSKLSHDLIMAEGRIDQLKAENSDLLDRLQKLTTSEAELKARSSKLGGGLDKVKNLLALKLTRPDVKDDPSRQKIVYRKKIFQLTIKDLFDRIAAKQPKGRRHSSGSLE